VKTYIFIKTSLGVYLLGFTFLILMTDCTKEENDPCQDITGRWEWFLTGTVYPSPRLTPQNTGINEILVFNSDRSWFNLQNGMKVDSGVFSLGHGTYQAYTGSRIYIYDSIAYFVNGKKLRMGDYYKILNDTLQFSPGYAGQFLSYSLPYNGAKFWKRINKN
jgi:hypothetical protein